MTGCFEAEAGVAAGDDDGSIGEGSCGVGERVKSRTSEVEGIHLVVVWLIEGLDPFRWVL